MEYPNDTKITIICPIYQEAKFIAHFLESIIAQDCNKKNLEVLLIDGMSTDGTRSIIQQYSEKYPYFHLMDNPEHTVPFALSTQVLRRHLVISSSDWMLIANTPKTTYRNLPNNC